MKFATDIKLRQKIRLQEGKHHHIPLLRYIVLIAGAVALPLTIKASIPVFTEKANDVTIMRTIGITMSITVVLLLVLILIICINRYLSHYVGYKKLEILELTDRAIEDEYTPIWERLAICKVRTEVDYSQIRRIENNTYHNAIKVYAPYSIISYVEAQRGKQEKIRRFDSPESFRVYYKYYYNSETLLEEISRRSGVRVDQVDTPDHQLRERR